tara:strand:+ start:1239 stop:1445 length:207 start_codon:yes stop_codon:yes gene_type:complete
MVLILAPVKIEVIDTRKIGIIVIKIRNKNFLFFLVNLNLNFFIITDIIIKNGNRITTCFIKKIIGFLK